MWHRDRKNYAYIILYYHRPIISSLMLSPKRILSKTLGRSAQEGSKSLDEPLLVMWPSWQVAGGCVLDMTICSFLAFIPFAAITSMPRYSNAGIPLTSFAVPINLFHRCAKILCVSSSKACACRIRRFLRQVVTEVHARASWSWPVWQDLAVVSHGMQWMDPSHSYYSAQVSHLGLQQKGEACLLIPFCQHAKVQIIYSTDDNTQNIFCFQINISMLTSGHLCCRTLCRQRSKQNLYSRIPT